MRSGRGSSLESRTRVMGPCVEPGAGRCLRVSPERGLGMAAGWMAARIMSRGKRGVLWYLVVGVVGAFLGGFLFGVLGLIPGGLIGSLVTATVGAVVLLWLLNMFKKA